MTTLKFWNTEIEADTDVTKLSGVTLLRYMQDLIIHETYYDNGQLGDEDGLGGLYKRVVGYIQEGRWQSAPETIGRISDSDE